MILFTNKIGNSFHTLIGILVLLLNDQKKLIIRLISQLPLIHDTRSKETQMLCK